jgi:uncharacterized protein (DUF433 family)
LVLATHRARASEGADRARPSILDREVPFSRSGDTHRGSCDVPGAGRDAALENIISSQLVFKRVLAPYLRGLEFDQDIAARWFPSTNRRIVIDPARSFGQPVVEKEGVPTSVLARSYKAEQSLKRVARWYDVDVRSVRAAVEFERRLAA